jgi:hypothetical protein
MNTYCPRCKIKYNVPENYCGRKAKCEHCNFSFKIYPKIKVLKKDSDCLTIDEEIKEAKKDLKQIEKFISDYALLSLPDYIPDSLSSKVDAVNNFFSELDDYIEHHRQDLEDLKKCRYRDHCKKDAETWKVSYPEYKRPTKTQFIKITDLLDKSFGRREWEENAKRIELFFNALKELYPELFIDPPSPL